MNIVIIGTSNSIYGRNGFIKSLKHDHNVIEFLTGRVPIYYHLKTLLINKSTIEDCDLLIIDHYVNDVNFYYDRLGDEYIEKCKIFYDHLSCLNINILNVLFPIFDLKERKSFSFYQKIKELSAEYDISLLDLNLCSFPSIAYKDKIHIHLSLSYIIGLYLSKELIRLKLNNDLIKPVNGAINSTPFRTITARDLSQLDKNNHINIFKNSLLSIEYIDLKKTITIKSEDDESFISIGYLRPKENSGNSGVRINNADFGLRGIGYYHEVVNPIKDNYIKIEPIFGNSIELDNLMGRGKSKGEFTYCYIVELFFYNESILFNGKPASRRKFEFNYPHLLELSESFFSNGHQAKKNNTGIWSPLIKKIFNKIAPKDWNDMPNKKIQTNPEIYGR